MSYSLDDEIINNNELNNNEQHPQLDMDHSDPKTTHYDTPANISVQSRETAIRHGFLEKCKLAEHGVKLKRRDWSSSYAYLFTGHLLFYKDQKSAEVIRLF